MLQVWLSEDKTDDVLTALVESSALIVGSSTYEHEVFPKVADFLNLLKVKKFSNRVAVTFGSFGWSGEATRKIGAELYYKGQNYFGSAEMNYKAGECSFQLKEHEKAVEFFTKAADISLAKGFDRFGLSALQNARESQQALGNTAEVEAISKKIDEINKKNAEPEEESSFSVFS